MELLKVAARKMGTYLSELKFNDCYINLMIADCFFINSDIGGGNE
jgi:hypothetical protein